MQLFLIILGVFEVLGIASAAHAIMSVRTPQGTIAWVLSLIVIPFIAVPAYWVFGRNKFHGYVLAQQDKLEQLADTIKQADGNIDAFASASTAQLSALLAAERLARLPLTGSNQVDLLIDGEATFGSIFDGISAARDYVLVQFYIIHDDGLGRELKSRLMAKAAEGVHVCLLYDEVGCLGLPESYLAELRDAGVWATSFHTRRGTGNRFQLNFRNHRKTVVVDGKVAWIGGHNVGDEYLGKDPKVGAWRDTHVRIEGPAAIAAQLAFVEDWHWATDDVPEGLSWQPVASPAGDAQALVISSGPADVLETASLMFLQAINGAAKRIWIASPYFVPDAAIVQALQLAGLRGVDVRILIPHKTDNWLVTMAAYTYFNQVGNDGVRIYRYEEGFLHGKAMLVDDRVTTVGTANFDNRSFRLNFESTAIIFDEAFAAEAEKMFEADFDRSRIMEPNEFDRKPVWFRLAARSARLAAPVL